LQDENKKALLEWMKFLEVGSDNWKTLTRIAGANGAKGLERRFGVREEKGEGEEVCIFRSGRKAVIPTKKEATVGLFGGKREFP